MSVYSFLHKQRWHVGQSPLIIIHTHIQIHTATVLYIAIYTDMKYHPQSTIRYYKNCSEFYMLLTDHHSYCASLNHSDILRELIIEWQTLTVCGTKVSSLIPWLMNKHVVYIVMVIWLCSLTVSTHCV